VQFRRDTLQTVTYTSPRENRRRKRERIEFEKFAHVSLREITRVPVVSVSRCGVAAVESVYRSTKQNFNTQYPTLLLLSFLLLERHEGVK
jgi:hypothetical protein